MATIRFLTAGESHGPTLTAIVDGVPAGLRLDLEAINAELARRQRGYGRGGRMKIESDRVDVLSGVRFGETLGSPVTLRVANRDWANWQERMAAFGQPSGEAVTAARPGHADYVGVCKYNRRDIRDILERSSARETAARVAVGALCKQLLAACGVHIASQVVNIGGVSVDRTRLGDVDRDLNCRDALAVEAMRRRIDEAKAAGDTLGGIFELTAHGLPIGLGSHTQWDRRLDGRIAAALMSIQAIKGVEIGAGFACADLPGSAAHDEMFCDHDGRVFRSTNHAGGLEGGMTNGEELVVRAVMKPIPTLMRPLHSIDIASREAVLACKERSDVCAVPAASVVGEAMLAIVLAQALTERFSADCMADLTASLAAYSARLSPPATRP